jgi:Asp-tRNA(Asn)/Glu-tRNA(Gln) amidotransferase A subunit family amidase
VLLTPTIDQIAPVIPDDWSYPYAAREAGPAEAIRQYVKYTMRVNLAGCCAASVPCGFVDGMPVGLQVIGRSGEEAIVLRVARALEGIMPWAQIRPPLEVSS